MSTFLSEAFKQAELRRHERKAAENMRAGCDPASVLAEVRSIFAHDEPLPRVTFEVYRGNPAELLRVDGTLYPDPDACPSIELAYWMATIGLAPRLWMDEKTGPVEIEE